ncbi:urease accessory protein UreD [Malaciobacter molluscorum]|uniref:urease accessory protein UreD n=1 Tax=Malaciobacter molluscorum TaxID=1032072 RepID=UPI00100C2C34|nr:urease accessory protein UreD [Malaciobacter molluscorum]RXJ94569.1 urease accessory protein UreD [Malaciobacter molluscorum]
MSIKFNFVNNKFDLKKQSLPSRHYFFNETENYIKLLNIGEGIFPKDRVKTYFSLKDSSLVLTTESATKIYSSKKEYGINSFNINLENSNLEFINDELILYKNSKYVQTFRLIFDETSTFFYTDILSKGRSFENFDFTSMLIKNSFYKNKKLEYIEKFDISGKELKNYIFRKNIKNYFFAKIYIKINHIDCFLDILHLEEFESFTYSCNKQIIIASISSDCMSILKKKIDYIWKLYRKQLCKKEFILGKQ